MSAARLAVLWDLDGTLADSEAFYSAATVAVLAECGISASRGCELIGRSRADTHAYLRARHEGVPDYRQYSDAVDRHLLPMLAGTRAWPASLAALQRFAAQSRAQYVVSNSLPEAVAATIAALGVEDCIGGWIANDGAGAAKPAADPYLRALAAIACDPGQAVVVEDSETGVAAARAAGVFVIGVGERHAELGADASYESFPDLDPERIVALVGK